MSTIVTRAGKGSALTHDEVDANFVNLNTDKYQNGSALGTPSSGNLANCTFPTLNQNTTGNAETATYATSAGSADSVPYSGLTGTIPTWNQNTTGNAATSDYATTAGNASTVTNGVYTTNIGSTVLAFDSNLQSFINTFTLPVVDSSAGYLLKTDGAGNLSFIAPPSGSGTVTSVDMTVPTGLSVSGNPITTSGTLAISLASGYVIPTTTSTGQWDSAYTERLQWNGGSTNLVASTGRTSLGATTIGSNLFTLTNPSAITFPRFNADNSVSALTASAFRTAIGVGTVTSVGGTGTVNGITLTGTVTSSGNLTLGGTLSGIVNSQLTNSSVTFNGQTVALGASGTITANTTNALTIGTGLSGTSFNGSSAVTIAIDSTVATLSGTQTLTNKRVTSRVGSTTSSATPTINTDNTDMYGLTAQTVDITSFTTNLSGTPTNGQKLWIYIVGTAARAITWGASFESSTATLPTTTVTTNRLDVGFVWNSATSKWRCVAVA